MLSTSEILELLGDLSRKYQERYKYLQENKRWATDAVLSCSRDLNDVITKIVTGQSKEGQSNGPR